MTMTAETFPSDVALDGPRRPVVGVGTAVVEKGALLMVERAGPVLPGFWAVPGGKVRWGETLAEAAVRETREETGLEVEAGRVIWTGQSFGPPQPSPGAAPGYHIVIIDFAARVTGGSLAAGDDARRVAFVPLEEVREYRLTPTMYELLPVLGV